MNGLTGGIFDWRMEPKLPDLDERIANRGRLLVRRFSHPFSFNRLPYAQALAFGPQEPVPQLNMKTVKFHVGVEVIFKRLNNARAQQRLSPVRQNDENPGDNRQCPGKRSATHFNRRMPAPETCRNLIGSTVPSFASLVDV